VEQLVPKGSALTGLKGTDQATSTLAVAQAEAPNVVAGPSDSEHEEETVPAQVAPDSEAQTSAYLASVRDRLEHRKRYPYLLRRQGIQGTVSVRFIIRTDGTPREIRVANGTSNPSLIEAAIQSVNAAAPFAPLPAGLAQELQIEVPIAFVLEDE
jgi:protein TonB